MLPDVGSALTAYNFRRPLPWPTQDPDASPSKSFTIACSWLPYVRGALLTLLLQYTWDQSDPAQVLLAQQRANTLLAMFVECDDNLPAIACAYAFAVSYAGWATFGHGGVYSPGTGWVSTYADPSDRAVLGIYHSPSGTNYITRVEFTIASVVDGSPTTSSVNLYINGTLVSQTRLLADTHVIVWEGTVANVNDITIDANSGDVDTVIVITDARFYGVSDNGCE